jgi:ubiquinone/menaquinone biosynthesis C-methylase UbiE
MKFLKQFILAFFIPFFGFAQYAEHDWEERDKWMDTAFIFEKAGVTQGTFVADIGCHEGYLSVRLANAVGATGRVFAVDVVAHRLETLKETLKTRDLQNVNVILGDYEDPKLPENELDVVIIMDSYHEMTNYMKILNHANMALKPEGTIVIVEKLKSNIKGKSRSEQTNAHSLSTKYVKEELLKAGFKVTYKNNDLGHWKNDEDKVIWMLVAKKE